MSGKPYVHWATSTLGSITFPFTIPVNENFSPFPVPFEFILNKDFKEKLFTTPQGLEYKALEYTGKKPYIFTGNLYASIQNNTENDIFSEVIVATGKNGNPPNELYIPSRDPAFSLANGGVITESTAFLIQLDPRDTIALFVKNDQPLTANQFVLFSAGLALSPVDKADDKYCY